MFSLHSLISNNSKHNLQHLTTATKDFKAPVIWLTTWGIRFMETGTMVLDKDMVAHFSSPYRLSMHTRQTLEEEGA